MSAVGVAPNRQTTRPVLHPQHGMGVLTYRNGPAKYCSAEGVQEDYTDVQLASWSADGGVQLTLTTPDGSTLLVTCCGPSSPLHNRVMLYDGQRGWLVWTHGEISFEPDDGGSPIVFAWTKTEAGPPGALKKYNRRKTPRWLPHERHWKTYTGSDGYQLVSCLEEHADEVSWPTRDRPDVGVLGAARGT